MTSKIFRESSVHFAYIYILLCFQYGLFCCWRPPPFCLFFGFQHTNFKLDLFCAQTPRICGYTYLFSKPNNHRTQYKRGPRQEGKKERKEKTEKMGASDKLEFTENLDKEKKSQYRQVKMMCQNLLFPYLHL